MTISSITKNPKELSFTEKGSHSPVVDSAFSLLHYGLDFVGLFKFYFRVQDESFSVFVY